MAWEGQQHSFGAVWRELPGLYKNLSKGTDGHTDVKPHFLPSAPRARVRAAGRVDVGRVTWRATRDSC